MDNWNLRWSEVELPHQTSQTKEDAGVWSWKMIQTWKNHMQLDLETHSL